MIVDQKVNKQYAGVYLLDGCVDGAQLATIKKKNGFQKVCARLFLGWVWVSIAKLKSKRDALKALGAKLKAEAEEALELLAKQEEDAVKLVSNGKKKK
jgi:hypothetical protein